MMEMTVNNLLIGLFLGSINKLYATRPAMTRTSEREKRGAAAFLAPCKSIQGHATAESELAVARRGKGTHVNKRQAWQVGSRSRL